MLSDLYVPWYKVHTHFLFFAHCSVFVLNSTHFMPCTHKPHFMHIYRAQRKRIIAYITYNSHIHHYNAFSMDFTSQNENKSWPSYFLSLLLSAKQQPKDFISIFLFEFICIFEINNGFA